MGHKWLIIQSQLTKKGKVLRSLTMRISSFRSLGFLTPSFEGFRDKRKPKLTGVNERTLTSLAPPTHWKFSIRIPKLNVKMTPEMLGFFNWLPLITAYYSRSDIQTLNHWSYSYGKYRLLRWVNWSTLTVITNGQMATCICFWYKTNIW